MRAIAILVIAIYKKQSPLQRTNTFPVFASVKNSLLLNTESKSSSTRCLFLDLCDLERFIL